MPPQRTQRHKARVLTDAELKAKGYTSEIQSRTRTIMRTNLIRLYRLKGEFLKAVPLLEIRDHTIALKNKTQHIAKMHLYLERDAEFQAWRMRGGKAEFIEYLYSLRRLWENISQTKKGGKVFPAPADYRCVLNELWISRTKDREEEIAEREHAGKTTETGAEQQEATNAKAAEKVAEPEEGPSKVVDKTSVNLPSNEPELETNNSVVGVHQAAMSKTPQHRRSARIAALKYLSK